MAIQLIPLVVAIVGGAATVGAGVYAYKSYQDAQEQKTPSAIIQQQAQPEAQPDAKKAPEIKVAESVLPQFDVLRVEPDGSAVIAGSAPANSLVEIVDGEQVIATTSASGNGDFAIVLDKPLPAGTYELHIRSTGEKGDVVVSSEAGIVKIPEAGGELLAMVTEPGAPSKLIQTPKVAPEPAPVVVEEPKPEPAPVAKAEPEPAPVAKVEPEPAPMIKVEPEPAPKEVVKLEPTVEPKPEPVPAPAPVVEAPVYLGAVEVDGDKLFIAGTGQPGRTVNLYVDGEFVGNAVVGSEGSFLLESNSKLTYGEHMVRADMLGQTQSVVVARAEVPLIHDGPAEPAPIVVAKAPEPKPVVVEEAAQVKPMVKETASEPAKEPVKMAELEPMKVEEPEPMKAAEPEPMKAAEPEPMKVVEPEPMKVEEPQVEIAKVEQPKIIKPKMVEPEIVEPKVVETKTETAQVEIAKVEKTQPQPLAVEKPRRVIRTGSSVIIRRGDNLWRISRRILGRGIRYSTIYQANKDQIRDPDLIYPGQIFAVPKKMVGVDGNEKG